MCRIDFSLQPGSRKGVILGVDGGSEALTVEERLKHLMQELGNAINESLSESDRIAAAIGEIKHAGYEVFLVLEATIGFNKREEGEEEHVPESGESRRGSRRELKIKWTTQDQKFLRALKISPDEDPRRSGA